MNWIAAARTLAAAAALALAACAQPAALQEPPVQQAVAAEEIVMIDTVAGTRRFTAEIANTDEERARGLMYRQTMADNHGMLFDFDPPEQAVFWMRNTPLSLDIIFIGADGRILNIAEHTTPFSDAPIPAAGEARGVFEIRAGRAADLGIRPGDRVRHRIFQP
ncbi:MAG: DUF192 domain-containing protein [Hyphomonadaceae bacterium]